MVSSSRQNEPGNPGHVEQNTVADALAAMHRRMADQDARIEEQMNEIHNLRQQLFGKLKPTEFIGSTDPLEAEKWLSSMETIFEFMRLTDRERDARHWWATVKLTRDVTVMSWADFIGEFNQKYYNSAILRAQQDKFLNLKQGTMTVIEAVNKFEQLSRLCPFMVKTEEDRLKRMMDMFRPDIALAIENGGSLPTIVARCVERAVRIEYIMAQVKEERNKYFEAKRNQRKEGLESQAKNSNRGSKPSGKPNQTTSYKKKGKPSG
ncbi:hypothetical protein UlMin_013420 [Ulmus minor]